jgi:DNA (cytosine-5)-methyltransferase 1
MILKQPNNIVLYSGPGGVSSGLRSLGLESIGIELSTDAVNSARANGLNVIKEDVARLAPSVFTGGVQPFLLQASPPCQGLSVAGTKTGRKDIDSILLNLENKTAPYNNNNSHLIVNLKQWMDTAPHIIILEQVIAIKPVWDWYEQYLESLGYSVWNHIVNMEQWGLAQTRQRAILIASLDTFSIESPPYSKFNGRSPKKYTGKSMQDVLPHWAGSEIGFPRKYDGRGKSISINNIDYRARDFRTTDLPSFALTEKARSWKRAGMFIDIDEAKILQGFDKDYIFTGARTSQYLQLGNAVPPQFIETLLKDLI